MHAIPSIPKEESNSVLVTHDMEAPNERTPMLPNKTNGSDNQVPVDFVSLRDQSQEPTQSTLDVLSDRNFWALAFIVFVVLGSCEMIISNIGTIVLSLPSGTSTNSAFVNTSSTVSMTATQVRALSISNTLSRLVVGPLADIVSPVGNRGTLREHRISRIAFMTFSTATLACTYTWMVIGVEELTGIWALTIGAGIAYGCAFTILPSLVSSIWGLSNLGRNYGIMTYAPFLGTPSFSYLYAFISDAGSASSLDGVCRGTACWTLTFEVSALAATLACVTSVYLWRAWKGRV